MEILNFSDIIENYKVIFFDSLGVTLCNNEITNGAKQAFSLLQDQGKPFYILASECNLSPKNLLQHYNKDSDLLKQRQIIHSGSLVTNYLKEKIQGSNIAYIGAKDCEYYIEEADKISIPFTEKIDVNNIQAIIVFDLINLGIPNNTSLLNGLINLLHRHPTIPCLFPNCDLVQPSGTKNNIEPSVGAVALLIEHIIERNVIRFGKPSKSYFNHALSIAKQQNPSLTDEDILYIGDSIGTDIVGGMIAGIDTCLCLSGNTLQENAELELARHNLFPNFIIESL